MTEFGIGRRAVIGGGAALAGAASTRRAWAQQAGPVRVGVLADENGPYSASAGPGATLAARMAAADFGPSVLGLPIEILHADTQNKPDLASTIAQEWYDRGGVDAIIDLPLTPVGVSVQQVAKQKQKTVMITAAAITEFTTALCSPISSHWADDTNSLAVGTGRAVVENGGKSWFFITVDFTFGLNLQKQTTAVIEANGGNVVGSTKFPVGSTDFSALLLQAQVSKADVIGLAAVGSELVNLIKQAGEFGLTTAGQTVAGFLVDITDIHALGPDIAHGLTFASGFYWNTSPGTRAWAQRFFKERGAMPSKEQAYNYACTTHFLKAMAKAGTRDPIAVNKAMRAMPVDFFGEPATLRADGRFMHDLALYRVKAKDQVRQPWDYLDAVRTIPRAEAFLPMLPACASV